MTINERAPTTLTHSDWNACGINTFVLVRPHFDKTPVMTWFSGHSKVKSSLY